MFDMNLSLFSYTGTAKRLLVSLKFEERRRLAPLFAAYVADAMRVTQNRSIVVPVPPRPGRHTPDATELVARALERNHSLRVLRLLERAGGVQQKSLDYVKRKENLAGRIHLASRAKADRVPLHAVLLDDVFTTGATLDACARALREAGCAHVDAITLVMEE